MASFIPHFFKSLSITIAICCLTTTAFSQNTEPGFFEKYLSKPSDTQVCLYETSSGDIQMVEVNETDVCYAPKKLSEEANNDCPNLNKFLKERTIDIDSGVGFNSRNFGMDLDWEFRLRPSFRSEAFLRTDIWTPRVYLQAPWDMFSFKIQREGRFVYTTNYPNACAAANPLNAKNPFDMPNTAEKAILEMRQNDYVRVDMETNFAINAADFSRLFDLGSPPMGINLNAYYILSGGFQIHISKIDDRQVRIWIVTDPAETAGIKVAFGMSGAAEITGINQFDKAIIRVFRLRDLISYSREAQRSVINLFDVTLDLSDPIAANAYNEALNGFLKLDIPNVGEAIGALPEAIADRSLLSIAENFYQLPINDLGPLFDIARDNARLDHCKPGTGEGTLEPCVPTSVVLNNDIANRASTNRSKWKIGLSEILSTENDTIYRTNRVTENIYRKGQDDFLKSYLIPSWQHIKKDKSIFGQGDQRVFKQANAIFSSDERFNPHQFLSMAFAYNERDTSYEDHEMTKLLKRIKRVIPNEFDDLKMYLQENGWLNFPNGKKAGVEVHMVYSFKEAGYLKLFGDPEYARSKTLNAAIMAYFEELEKDDLLQQGRKRAVNYTTEIERLSRVLSDVFDPNLTNKERYDKFARLRNYYLFVEFGAGILVHLASKKSDNLKELMAFSLELYGRKEIPVEYKFGEDENQELAKIISFTEDILNRLDNDGVVVFGEAPAQ